MLALAFPPLEEVFATVENELRMLPRVMLLLINPMPPIQTSLPCVVVAVVPVTGEVLLLVELAVWSTGLAANTPLYSATTAATFSELAKLMVTVVPAPETLVAYQIDTVTPAVLATVAARVQVAPVWVTEDTRPVVVPLVVITATSVLPLVGAATVTPKEVTALELPLA